ncbi:unnamed protein product [Rotaria sp. Silwood2]|nr:unnamed protein product [Rotaria sp. Silwood2]CAF2961674.1 unnamed protein product [Rotaria sp. Silwood2]CAF3335713.1 unnamed protein product [Rotaria sp. Silwood2]CAF4216586.1 unnamed protein product [Rotaria sp. Silwood2]CAF4345542.1 unnamed protein product [Rotaria sp. Silwood2]
MNLLVVTLWYLKLYHSECYIAAELYLDPSTVHHILTEVVNILHSCIYSKLVSLPADMTDINTTYGPEENHKLLVDSTYIVIPQPNDSRQRKAYYHSKSSTNCAFKVRIACDFNHQIVHISECYQGSVHDITILRESGLLEYTEEYVQIITDKGYIGEEYVITSKKKPHGGEQTTEDTNFNRNFNSARVAIENINQRFKTYAIMDGVYRGIIDDFHKITKIVQVVCALCNLNLSKHPIRK